MTGTRLTIPTSFTNTDLPILRADPMLTAGSLALYEIGHPAAGIAGVPASGALIPNIALAEAKALIPGATDATLAAVLKSSTNEPTKIKIERTSRGGLHGLIAKASPATPPAAFVGLYGQAALAQYLLTNVNHEFFISYWGIETRSPVQGPGALNGLSFSSGTSATNLHWVMSHDGNMYPLTSLKTGAKREANSSPVGNMSDANTAYPAQIPAKLRLNMGVKGSAAVVGLTPDQVIARNYFKLFSAGAASELFANYNAGPSSNIHYRTYIEDLTVSGRSYAEADAIDLAEFTKHVTTPGGRYYADTYTDPATLP